MAQPNQRSFEFHISDSANHTNHSDIGKLSSSNTPSMQQLVICKLIGSFCDNPLDTAASSAHASLLIDYIISNEVDISAWCSHPYACDLLHSLIEKTQPSSLLGKLVSFLSTRLSLNEYMDERACDVLCKLVQRRLPFSSMRFMASTFYKHFVILASHIHSHRLIMAFIRAYGDELSSHFWHGILFQTKPDTDNTFLHLCQLERSHLIVVQLIECNVADLRNALIDKILSDKRLFLQLSQSQYGCNIVELCIKHASLTQIADIIGCLVDNNRAIYDELRYDPVGCVVLNSLIIKCGEISKAKK